MEIPTTDLTQQVNILPKLASASLLSVGKVMDNGWKAHFTKDNSIISKEDKKILQGRRNKKDGLYNVELKIEANNDPTHEKN